MLFLVTDQRMLLMIYRQLDVQSKHDDSGGTNTVLSFFLEHSADGSSWKYYKANGANKVPIQILQLAKRNFLTCYPEIEGGGGTLSFLDPSCVLDCKRGH